MYAHRFWYATGLVLVSALAGLAADKDVLGDPLPPGATARLGTTRLRLPTYTPPVLAPDGKTLFATSSTGLQRLDPATGAALGKAVTQVYGSKLVPSADGKRIALASSNGAAVCEVATGKVLVKLDRPLPSTDGAIAISADGTVLALGGAGDRTKKQPVTVLIWNVTTDKELHRLPVPQNEYANVALSADGKQLASWGAHFDPGAKNPPDPDTDPNRVVTFWDVTTGKEQAKFRVAGFSPASVTFAPDGRTAAVAGGTGSIDLVDPKTGASKLLLLGRSRMGRGLSFGPDGATLAASADDGAVQRWKVADGTRLSTTEPPVAGVQNVGVRAVSAEVSVAWGTRGSTVVVWEVPSGKLVSPDGGHTESVRGLAITSDGKHVLTSSEDGTARKWELATGKPLGTVPIRTPNLGFSYPPVADLSPDATRALVRELNGVGVHDLATGIQQYVIPTPTDGPSYAAFSPDGARIVLTTASYNPEKSPGRVAVWDAASAKRLVAIELPGYGPVAAAVTPDGKHLITAGLKPSVKGNGTFVVTVWEVATGAKKGELGEEGGFTPPRVATAPDNRTAAIVTAKGKLVAFDIPTGQFGKTYDLNERKPSTAPVFSPDGTKLAVAGLVEYTPAPRAPVLVLDWATGATKYTFAAPGGPPAVMAFAPDGKALVTGLSDTTAIVWDVGK